jgi:hypothetical protein
VRANERCIDVVQNVRPDLADGFDHTSAK